MFKEHLCFENCLFLDVLKGAEEICNIHQILYDNEFKVFDKGLKYIPHMTIGKMDTVALLNKAFDSINSADDTFSTIVKKVSVEMIGDNEESVIVVEKELV